MSTKSGITEVELLAFTRVIATAHPAAHNLISQSGKVRKNAYERIHAALAREHPELTGKIVELFASTGDLVGALAAMQARMDIEKSQVSDTDIGLLWDSCSDYGRLLRQNESSKKMSEAVPGSVDLDSIGQVEKTLGQIQRRVSLLLKHMGESVEAERTRAKYEIEIGGNLQNAIYHLRKIINTDSVEGADFITLGNLLLDTDDTLGAIHVFETGFDRMRSVSLFAYTVRSMLSSGDERGAKEFFDRYSSGNIPLSLLRGKISSLEELPETERVIAAFFSNGIKHEWQSVYIKSVSKRVEKEIQIHEIVQENMRKAGEKASRKRGKTDTIMALEEVQRELLRLYEFQIYYLLEFKNLEKYLSVIDAYLESEKGRLLLSRYFDDTTLEELGPFFEVEGVDEIEDPTSLPKKYSDEALISPDDFPDGPPRYLAVMGNHQKGEDEDETVIYSIHPLASVGLKSQINRRYSYLQMRLGVYDPYIEPLRVKKSDQDISLEGTPEGDEIIRVDDSVDRVRGVRKELIMVAKTLRDTHPESEVFLESVILEQKVRTEEKGLMHAGAETEEFYGDFLLSLDEDYSVTERRYLQWQARDEKYTGSAIPPCCSGDPLLVMAFICERLIAGYEELFEGKLFDIMQSEPLLRLSQVDMLTFVEILTSKGFYDETVNLIIHYDGSLYDPDMLLVLARICVDAGYKSDWVKKVKMALDECSQHQYDKPGFFALIQEVHENQREDTDMSPEDRETQKTGLAMMEYVVGVFLSGEDGKEKEAEKYISRAIGLGFPDAIYFRAQEDMKNPKNDRENILVGLLKIFPTTPYPTRGNLYPLILRLLLESGKTELFSEYLSLALKEGVEVSTFPVRTMVKDDDARSALYSYMMLSDQSFDLLIEDMIALQEAMHQDIRTPYVPIDIKIRASVLRTNIASHPDFGFCPAVLEHMYFLDENISKMEGKDVKKSCTDAFLELHRTFDGSGPEEYQFPNLMNYHITYLRGKIIDFINDNKDNTEGLKVGLLYYSRFVDAALSLLLKVSGIKNISLRFDPDDPKTTVPAIDFWLTEREKNRVLLHNLMNPDNLEAQKTVKTPGFQADGSYLFQDHPNIH